MPKLVRTPEDVLRQTKRDLYLVKFNVEDPWTHFGASDNPGKTELVAWLRRELPDTELEDLGPSEKCGVITGWVGRQMRIDFSPATLRKFCSFWEDNQGKSLDPRWQCYQIPYADHTYSSPASESE